MDGLPALDSQLLCYSWMTGISEVAQVVFVRKRLVEVQYLRTTITDEQRAEFSQLVQDTIQRIETAQFLPHSGIRFPQNPCSTCPYVGLCLGKQNLVQIDLVRRPGAEQNRRRKGSQSESDPHQCKCSRIEAEDMDAEIARQQRVNEFSIWTE